MVDTRSSSLFATVDLSLTIYLGRQWHGGCFA